MKRHAPEEVDSEELPLFDRPRAHANDPRTSHAAASRVDEFAGRQQRAILHVLQRLGGMTSDEVAESGVGLTKVQVARRMGELRNRGLVVATEGTRPTPSGRQATVWRAI